MKGPATHAHYCDACKGYSPCHGYYDPCLLTDSCVKCDRTLDGERNTILIERG